MTASKFCTSKAMVRHRDIKMTITRGCGTLSVAARQHKGLGLTEQASALLIHYVTVSNSFYDLKG
jgi:hypothetical protein